jgi:hypothetical protein
MGCFFIIMNNTKDILLILCLLLGLGIYLDIRFNGAFDDQPTIISKDTIVVNLPQQTFNLPPSAPISIVNNQLPSKIDTGAILKAYFSEVTYLDSVDNDTLKIVLKEVISRNAIVSRELTHRLKIPITKVIETTYQPKGMFYYGASATYGQSLGLSPMLGYKNKKEQVFFGSYDPINKSIQVGGLLPLKKIKP